MQLGAALFDRVAQSLSGDAAPRPETAEAAGNQRRREPRVGVRAQVTVIPLTDGLSSAPFEIPLRDLSAGGIGFVHGGPVSLDDQFVVLLPGGGESVAVLCQVAYYQPLADRVCAVGAKFLRVLRQPAEDAGDAIPLQQPAPLRAAS